MIVNTIRYTLASITTGSKQPLKSSHLFVNMFSAALTARLKDPLIRIENLQREGRGSINVFFQLSAHDFGERHITIITL